MSDAAAADAGGWVAAAGRRRPISAAAADARPAGAGGSQAERPQPPSCSFHGRRPAHAAWALQTPPTNARRWSLTRRHLSIVICGHVDSGKSTTTGRLLFELGGIPERELEKLKVRLEPWDSRSARSARGRRC